MTRKLLGVWFHLEKNVQGGPATIGGVQDNEVYGMYDILVNDASYIYWFYDDNNWVSSDYIQSSQYGILRLGNFGKKPKRNAFG
jgi:hypothetical protein